MRIQHEAEINEKLMPSMPTEKPSMLRKFFFKNFSDFDCWISNEIIL